jgi:hypothetical protein
MGVTVPVYRMQCVFQFDDSFARSGVMITPHFDDKGVGSDPGGLAQDLANALDEWEVPPTRVTVKAYDAQGTPPVYPVAEKTGPSTSIATSAFNREIALALSFYSERNVKRQRGRVFAPMVAALGAAPTGPRPSGAQQQKVADLAVIFQDLGGPDVDWVVYSRLDDVARPVTNWWVDNAWDVIRSRGLAPSARLEGTTSEA